MTQKEKKYLYDIKMAIDKSLGYTEEINRFSIYQDDDKTQSAVERQLIIVGEALNQLSKINKNFPISDTPNIVSFRNMLVHAYDNINARIVWNILNKELLVLKAEVYDLIESFEV